VAPQGADATAGRRPPRTAPGGGEAWGTHPAGTVGPVRPCPADQKAASNSAFLALYSSSVSNSAS